MVTPLSDDQRGEALADLPHWRYDAAQKTIRRDFRFKDFSQVFAFLSGWRWSPRRPATIPKSSMFTIEWAIGLTTHEAGGVSERDIGLAARIDAILDMLAKRFQWKLRPWGRAA